MQFSSWYLQLSIREDEELCFKKWKIIQNQHFYSSWLKNSLKFFYSLKHIFLLKWNKKPKSPLILFSFQVWGLLFDCFFYKGNKQCCVLVNSTGRTLIKVKSQWIIDKVLVVLFGVFVFCFVLILEQYKYLIQILYKEREEEELKLHFSYRKEKYGKVSQQ